MSEQEWKPGPELDAAVAKAMGLDVVGMVPVAFYPNDYDIRKPHGSSGREVAYGEELRPVYVDRCICDRRADLGWKEEDLIFGHTPVCLEPVHHYSTGIAAAWQVVEKKRLVVRPTVAFENWAAGALKALAFDGTITVHKWHEAPTAPHAICLAMLAEAE